MEVQSCSKSAEVSKGKTVATALESESGTFIFYSANPKVLAK